MRGAVWTSKDQILLYFIWTFMHFIKCKFSRKKIGPSCIFTNHIFLWDVWPFMHFCEARCSCTFQMTQMEFGAGVLKTEKQYGR